jgi:hypothetical protein
LRIFVQRCVAAIGVCEFRQQVRGDRSNQLLAKRWNADLKDSRNCFFDNSFYRC